MSAKPRYRVKAPSVYIRDGERWGVVINMAEYAPEPMSDEIACIMTTLKDLLDRGLVDGLAVVVTTPPGADCDFLSLDGYAAGSNRLALVGAMQFLQDTIRAGASRG